VEGIITQIEYVLEESSDINIGTKGAEVADVPRAMMLRWVRYEGESVNRSQMDIKRDIRR
jgi:hypothetical protein